MSEVGRNELCPCGSGKKHKRCCGVLKAPQLPAYTQAERQDALHALFRFAQRDYSAKIEAVVDAMMAPALALPERDRNIPDEHAQMIFGGAVASLLFDRGARHAPPLASVYLDRYHARLTAGQRRYIDRMVAGNFDLCRVVETSAGVGMVLERLGDGDAFQVEERTASQTLLPGDCFAAYVMEGPTGVARIDGGIFVFQPAEIASLLKNVSTIKTPQTRSIRIVRRYVEGFSGRLPEIRTREGDPFESHTTYYDILNASDLAAALEGRDDIDRSGDAFVWLDGHSILATMELRKKRLIVQTFSRQRNDAVCRLLDEIAPHALAYRTSVIEDIVATVNSPANPSLASPEA